MSVAPIPTEKTQQQAEEDRRERDEKMALDRDLTSYTGWQAIFSGVIVTVGIFQLVLFIWQLRLIRDSVDDARKAALYTHRPRLRVRRVTIEGDSIRYVIANIGNTAAYITRGSVSVRYWDRELGLPNFPGPMEPVNIGQETIEAGSQISSPIEAKEILEEFAFENPFPMHNQTKRLYFHGFIKYSDDLGNIRETSFCRIHDGQRFVPVDNPDHEYED